MFARGLEHAPDDAPLLRALGGAARAQGLWEEALAHQRRALELDPRSWESARALGYTLMLLRRTREARAASERGLALAPANLPPHFGQGHDLPPGRGPRGGTRSDGGGAERSGADRPRDQLRRGRRSLLGARRGAARRVAAPDAGGFRRRPRDLGDRPRAGVGAEGRPGEGARIRRGGTRGVRGPVGGIPARRARRPARPGPGLPGPQGRGQSAWPSRALPSRRSRSARSRAHTCSTRPYGSTSSSATASGRWSSWNRC